METWKDAQVVFANADIEIVVQHYAQKDRKPLQRIAIFGRRNGKRGMILAKSGRKKDYTNGLQWAKDALTMDIQRRKKKAEFWIEESRRQRNEADKLAAILKRIK